MKEWIKAGIAGFALVIFLSLPAVGQAQFAFTTNNGAITITRYTGADGDVIIPSAINGLPVTSIDIYAFLNGFNVTNVVIPNGVTNIGFGAFYYCSALASISIPNTVATIGEQAFANCWSLTNVIIPSSAKSIPVGVFYYCSSLAAAAIPNGVTNIGESAFYACANLANITIPNSVQTIGGNAFALCASLTNVSIPSSVTQIAGNSFYACSALEGFIVAPQNPAYTNRDGVLFSKNLSLLVACPPAKSGSYVIPDGVTRISDFAFAVCRSLTNIIIPSSVTNLGFWAFSQCESIRRVTIPKSVQYIDDFAFQDCTLLREVYFAGNAPLISGFGSRIFIGDQLSLYYLPNTTGWDTFFSFLNVSGILWNPQIQTSDASFGVQANHFSFSITGTSEIPIVIEAATNFSSAVWVTLQSGPLTNGLIYFSDPNSANFSQRFYQIRSP